MVGAKARSLIPALTRSASGVPAGMVALRSSSTSAVVFSWSSRWLFTVKKR